MLNQTDIRVSRVRNSLLFDEEWYRETYQIPEELDAAEHYAFIGYKKNYDPSIHFSTSEYLDRYPDVAESGMCPLFHYEEYGIYEKRKVNIYHMDELRSKHPECLTSLDGGIMRLRITNRCPGRCRYCGQQAWSEAEQQREMNPTWYFEYCKPLYEKLHLLLITGGYAFSARESYNYMQWMSENYPGITIITESNGMPFHEKFQKLAAENLFSTHFSLNASNAEVFEKSCWGGDNAKAVYEHIMSNIQNYMELLKERDLLCFAPNFSMVINRDNADDVYAFVCLCLKLHATKITFYFDYTESNMYGEYFSCPDTSRRALQTLMEIERVLEGRVYVQFRLWVPAKELAPMQAKVDTMEIGQLRDKYADVLKMAEGRDIQREYEERNRVRKTRGKKELSFEEDVSATLRQEDRFGEMKCASPWEMIDIYPTGRMDFCGWFINTLNIYDFIESGVPDWKEIMNAIEYMVYRKHILSDNYKGCLGSCPMKPKACE